MPMLEAIKLRINPMHDLAGRERFAGRCGKCPPHLAHHATLSRLGRNK